MKLFSELFSSFCEFTFLNLYFTFFIMFYVKARQDFILELSFRLLSIGLILESKVNATSANLLLNLLIKCQPFWFELIFFLINNIFSVVSVQTYVVDVNTVIFLKHFS